MSKEAPNLGFKIESRGIPSGNIRNRIAFHVHFLLFTIPAIAILSGCTTSGYDGIIYKEGKSYDRSQSYVIIGNKICKEGKTYKRDSCYVK